MCSSVSLLSKWANPGVREAMAPVFFSNGTYSSIITQIKVRAESFNCRITHEGRASYTDAYSLAKFSVRLAQGCHVWLLQPHDALCIPHNVVFDDE